MAAIAQGDSQALEVLYDRYAAIVYRMGLRMLKNPEMAEDLVQEVFWRVWRRSASFERERGRVAQWLFGIAHNLCIDELRRLRSRPTPVYEDVEHPIIQQLIDEQMDVPAAAWATEQRRVIAEVLCELPQAQRQAIELAYFGGMSHQEIATKLNRPLGTIKTRVRLGLQKLGGLLEARGLRPSLYSDI
ncbi:MAG TPA: sigma-70 family RNA polymerase sigma factor [Kouleothrix sp.]|nr:sigma-70 family RNA polymerase sigma factor [Kouleothrix sp.]HRC74391.1 sigma-70 family RNA polymerase sigma factor [Kouleothrix sp.]